MRKNILVNILLLTFAVLSVTSVTLAWFSHETEPITNEFTAGTVMITADQTVTATDTMMENWNPGDCGIIEYTIRNIGSKTIAVRAILSGQWYENDGITPVSFDADQNVYISEFCSQNMDHHWVKDGDIWYYTAVILGTYTSPEPDEREGLLRLNICLDGKNTDNRYQGKVFRLTTTFEAVQSSNDAVTDVWQVGDDFFSLLSLKNNQQTLLCLLEALKADERLPTIESGTPAQNRNELRNLIIQSSLVFKNPFNGCENILSTGQAGSQDSASVMIAQRNVDMQTAIDLKSLHMWPLNAAESSQNKYVGTVVVQICSDGYLVYTYPYVGEVLDVIKFFPTS